MSITNDIRDTVEPVRKYGQFSFPVPRLPHIRVWALKEHYPDAPWVHGYDDPGNCFRVSPGTNSAFAFTTDEKDSDTWTTADTTDFVFLRRGTAERPVEGWIYLSLGESDPPKYTLYVHDDGSTTGTVFGDYTGAKEKPNPFPDGGENYFWEMSDYQGLWLWLYRLYAPAS
jgi:hypothetical protein